LTTYNVQLENQKEELFDTIVSLQYLENNLHLLKKFNYEKFDHISKNENSLLLISNNISFEIITSKFDSSNNKLEFKDGKYQLEKINDKPFWGTDGDIPTRKISKMVYWNNDSPVDVPSKYYNDLYQPNLHCYDSYCYIYGYKTERNEIVIIMNNSDGAGGYTAILILDNNGNIKDRIVGYGF
jgi:hypothetical protein